MRHMLYIFRQDVKRDSSIRDQFLPSALRCQNARASFKSTSDTASGRKESWSNHVVIVATPQASGSSSCRLRSSRRESYHSGKGTRRRPARWHRKWSKLPTTSLQAPRDASLGPRC